MAKNFSFMLCGDGKFSPLELKQGDILERTPEFASVINEAHSFYATTEDYQYFMVLTPTCELVRRQGKCSSRYISIAAIRPMTLLIDRQLEKYKRSINKPGVYCLTSKRRDAERFVDRLIHNTEEGYFFLPGEFFPDRETDRCAFLMLSIALRAEHFDSCVAAKYLQLSDVFSAKVRSLAANLYGQIGTEALEEQIDINAEEIMREYRKRLLDRAGVHWISSEGLRLLKAKISSEEVTAGRPLNHAEIGAIVSKTPSDESILAEQVSKVLISRKIIDPDMATEVRNIVASDPLVQRMLKST